MKKYRRQAALKGSSLILLGGIGAIVVGYVIVSVLYWANYLPGAERSMADVRRQLSDDTSGSLEQRQEQYDSTRAEIDDMCDVSGVVAWQRALEHIDKVYQECTTERKTYADVMQLYAEVIAHQKAEAQYAQIIYEANEATNSHSGADTAYHRKIWSDARTSIATYDAPESQKATQAALLQAIDGMVIAWRQESSKVNAGELAVAYDRLSTVRLHVDEPGVQLEERLQRARQQLLAA